MKWRADVVEQRAYHQRVRAESAAATEKHIREAASAAFAAEPYERVTLDSIAQRAGVRIPTVLRHFANKERLFCDVIQQAMSASQQARAAQVAPSLAAAVALVVDHFEQRGALIVHFLMQEEQVPAIRAITDEGRQYHRKWAHALVAPFLPALTDAARETLLIRLWALTDVWFWQTMRQSLGQSRAATEETILTLLEGAIAAASTNTHPHADSQ